MNSQNRVRRIQEYGQSIWLDYIRRDIFDGKLQQMIEEDGLRGITSNPSIFQEAIAESEYYDETIRDASGQSVEAIYWDIAIEDIQQAADILRPTYDELDGRDGFVSLEVSPHLALKAKETIAEAHHLWERVDRPNIFIKVPATQEGLVAIQQLIADGINVNVTLLFSLSRYRQVADAYMTGIEQRLERGYPVDRVASVASFFLSRIDVLVDEKLEEIMEAGGDQSKIAEDLYGEVAIANARVAYQIYQEMIESERWKKLAARGARPQRLLWASTGTKNPSFSDVRYVEALIGPETVNTLPMKTLDAFRDHGEAAPRLTENVDKAHMVLGRLIELGIDLDQVANQLEEEGIKKFVDPFDSLFSTLEERLQQEQADVRG
jgi:transaldolase